MDRYALFTEKEAAEQFAAVIQSFCAGMSPIVFKKAVYIEWLGKWAIRMEREPADLDGIEVVDSVEQASEEKNI